MINNDLSSTEVLDALLQIYPQKLALVLKRGLLARVVKATEDERLQSMLRELVDRSGRA